MLLEISQIYTLENRARLCDEIFPKSWDLMGQGVTVTFKVVGETDRRFKMIIRKSPDEGEEWVLGRYN